MQLSVLVDMLMELLSKGRVTASYLAEKYGVSERSVYRYVKELSASAPVFVKRGREGGIYLSDCFTLPKGYMLQEEYETAIEALDEAYFQKSDERFLRARRKLSSQLKKEIYRRSFSGAADSVFIDDGGWDGSAVGTGVLGLIAECIRTHEVLEIEYSEDEKNARRRVEPHALIIKRDVRFLYAFCRKEKCFKSFRLSGILTAVKTDEAFFRRPFKLDNVPFQMQTPESEFISVRLQIGENALREAQERFGERNVRLWNGKWIADLSLPSDDQTVKRILQLGSEIKVLAPETLQRRVKEAAQKVAAQY